ncbi:MAG TPA: hypothetical protein VJA26_16275 [Gammaproteobacteria bacterium]|nr:hypothetical protein [Gammaproteobacteria bacterium]
MRVTFLLSLLLIQGCAMTPVVWTKLGVEENQAAADIRDCRLLAADEMWRLGWERNWPPRFYDPLFMPPFYRGPRPFWFDFPMSMEREQALVDFCMHSKGYRLQAVPY